jgi:FkbM family methyltransferase
MNHQIPRLAAHYYEYLFLQTLDTLCTWSVSERFQDIFGLWVGLLIESSSRSIPQHTFIEFGGMHPITNSNSYLLEKTGWIGGVSEPNPAFKPLFIDHRKCAYVQAGLSNKPGKTLLYIPARRARASTILANLDESPSELQSFEIEVITLSDLVRQLGLDSITFLSADTEGGEFEILKAFPQIDTTLSAFCIEVDKVTNESLEESRRFFESKGFLRVFDSISGPDDWYLKKSTLSYLPTPSAFSNALDTYLTRLSSVPLTSQERAFKNRSTADKILAMMCECLP